MINRHPRRIVITGIGVIAPTALNIDDFWKSVLAGRSPAQPTKRFDTSQMPCKFTCEVQGFSPELYISPEKARRLDPSILFAVAAAKLAVQDAKLNLSREDLDRIGVFEGTASAALHHTMQSSLDYAAKGWRGVKPTRNITAFPGAASSEVAIELNLQAMATTICTACAAGSDAMGHAANAIYDDVADVMIAGAADAPIEPPAFSLFAQSHVMSRWTGDPSLAMKPFDRDRDGFIFGEGAAFVVLEELGRAIRRGARIYCEWLGHGQACDAFSNTSVHPEGRGLRRAIERALFQANGILEDVHYINPHASATPQNDPIESQAIRKVFGAHADNIAIAATKPITGHMMGATSAFEAIICALAIHHRLIPPSANLRTPGEGCDLDYVRTPRQFPVRTALNINLGFGGKASALLLGRFAP